MVVSDDWDIVESPPDPCRPIPLKPTLRTRLCARLRELWPWVSKRNIQALTLHTQRLLNEVVQNERLARQKQDATYEGLSEILLLAKKIGRHVEASEKRYQNILMEAVESLQVE